jgi:protein Mpv17
MGKGWRAPPGFYLYFNLRGDDVRTCFGRVEGCLKVTIGMLARCFHRYDSALRTTPIRTKLLTSCFLGAAGDLFAQSIDHSRKAEAATADVSDERSAVQFTYDQGRGMRQVAWSAALSPIVHTWYNLLQNSVLGSSVRTAVAKRILLDQLAFSPVVHIGFFAYMALSHGGGGEAVRRSLEDKLVPAMQMNYAVWPATQAVNFSVVPLRYRVFVVNIVGFFYATFLSLSAHET